MLLWKRHYVVLMAVKRASIVTKMTYAMYLQEIVVFQFHSQTMISSVRETCNSLHLFLRALSFIFQIISSASPCADFLFQSLSSELKKTHVQSHTHGSQRAVKQSFDEAVRLVQRCSEVDLNVVVLWKVCIVVRTLEFDWVLTCRK